MGELVVAHCAHCGKVQKCEIAIEGCLSVTLRCTVCTTTWREEADI